MGKKYCLEKEGKNLHYNHDLSHLFLYFLLYRLFAE